MVKIAKLCYKCKMLVILHNIRSLHNVGSIFRTADAAGVEKIYLCGYTPAPVDEMGRPRQPLAKVSLGAEKTIAWEKVNPHTRRGVGVKSTTTIIKKLKKEGYKILAVEQDKKSVPYNQVKIKPREKVALVMGAEIEGVPKPILKNCDNILEIPMRGKKESLNVAVAFGIIIFRIVDK